MLKVKVILGSTRPNRFSDKAGAWIAELAKAQEGFEVEVLDLRDYPLPFYQEPVSPSTAKEPFADSTVAAWTAKIAEADAFIIVTPEYNHGTSAVLKNAIDYVGKAWNRKPAAFVSYGTVGGARAVDQLRPVLAELQMATIRTAVHIFRPWELLDTEGKLEAGALDVYASSAQMMLTDLAWWGNALQTARNQK